MTHCLASCCSLISSSLAFAAPAATRAAAPKQVVVKKYRIDSSSLDVVVGCRCDDLNVARFGTIHLGRVFGSVSQPSKHRGILLSRCPRKLSKKRRRSLKPAPLK